MNFIVYIALRNLLRQKRRNILLGISIAFGMMILVLANSFSRGMSEIIFNKIIKYTSGHISVSFSQNGNLYRMIFKDGDRVFNIAKNKIPDISSLQEAIGIMARAIGNKGSDNVIMIGIDPYSYGTKKEEQEAAENFKIIDGNFFDLTNPNLENPVLISDSKARTLNVKLHDIISVRYQDINGQHQTCRLTVAGIFKPVNIFMSAPILLYTKNLKKIAGYGPHDIGGLYITLKTDPKKNAKKWTDSLYNAFKPKIAYAYGNLSYKQKSVSAIALGYKNDSLSKQILMDSIKILNILPPKKPFGKDGIAIGFLLQKELGIKVGDSCIFSYQPKYEDKNYCQKFYVTTLIEETKTSIDNSILINENLFYDFYYNHWPKSYDSLLVSLISFKQSKILNAFVKEWILLKRAKTTQELQKQIREIAKIKSRAITISVQSMYESASVVLGLEVALNLITFVAVMILFFIILIGVVNSLRMTIKERTREIGTIRAIGMQKNHVRNIFLLETFFLTLFSCICGIIMAFVVMTGLSLIKIYVQDNPLGMLLVNGHIKFVPTFYGIVFYTTVILLISVATAYFPSKKAARMSAASALRHYE